jgi:hypothetical protein
LGCPVLTQKFRTTTVGEGFVGVSDDGLLHFGVCGGVCVEEFVAS